MSSTTKQHNPFNFDYSSRVDDIGIALPEYFEDGIEKPRPSGLRYWQERVFLDTARFRVVNNGRRCGKALKTSTPIPTPKGFVPIGDLKVGDKVFDENGKVCNVTFHTGAYTPETYFKLTLSDGSEFYADGEHQWVTQTKADRKRDRQGTTKTTQNIYNTLLHKEGTSSQESNHSISITKPILLPQADLPLDPYLFGCWLGDGHSYTSRITTMDEEIVERFNEEGFLLKPVNYQNAGKATTYHISHNIRGEFVARLNNIGIERTSKKKFLKCIPEAYIFSSRAQRLELLRGIMDTDGSIRDKGNICEVTFKSKRLSSDTQKLINSLGMKVTQNLKVVNGNKYYRLNFRCTQQIFFIERKAVRFDVNFKFRGKQHLRKFILSCEMLDYKEEVCCIQVDSPNHLYLAGEAFTVTHNTILALNELLRAAMSGYKKKVWYVAPTYKQAESILWEFLKDAIPKENILKKDETKLFITLKGYESTIQLKGAENAESLRGNGLDFVVVDEVQDVDMQVIDVILRPAMSDHKADGLYIGTPKGMGENTMYKLFLRGKTRSSWKSWTYTTEQGGNVDIEEIESAKEDLSLTEFRQEYEASFEAVQGRVFYNFSPTESIRSDLKDTGAEVLVGMDFNVAKMTACAGVKVGDEFHLIKEFVIENANTRLMCQEISKAFPGRKIVCFPDPSGNNRSTKSDVGQTDFSIIKEFGFTVIAPKKAPLVVDSVNEVNRMLENASGRRRLFVSSECEEVVRCLDGLLYKKGTSEVDKDGDLDHMVDALRYIISNQYPINKKVMKMVKLPTVY